MTSPHTSLALGIIGAGIMGERMMNAVLGQDGATVRIAALWDPAPAARERIAARFPGVPVVSDAAAVVAASDCVYIASPPASHLGHARAALAAGRSVFCEKPLAVDLAEARAFVAEAGSRGAVNFPFASSLGVATLAQWIAEGAVGTPQRLTIEVAFARWPRPWQEDAAAWLDAPQEGGFTREVVSHFLFLSRRLLGPLDGLDGHAVFPESGRSERAIDATFRAGGVPVLLRGRVGETAHDDHNTWTLEGETGAVRLRDWAIAERRGEDGRFAPAADAMPNERARPIALRRQLEGVARMTRGEPHALATLTEALEVQEVVEAILASRQA
ncbi:oxidoreductase [Methylobacterium indicum]|uniref:Gfo/Idh/MocA family protein n=1 Tax=Methylobacterium indicum TaxID=1775910 RepID=UPI000734D0EF|nr:Gfo/Idh/MocA family oxidoreductase [Methylobacterium indicum]KTS24764.1 oxidoreductase [Methylobacterium indicum]KTS25345.1 oxidoreductase [Methylobacterium indicum]KTS53486.1 oxidoreductase [Methylobacterium indicum]